MPKKNWQKMKNDEYDAEEYNQKKWDSSFEQ